MTNGIGGPNGPRIGPFERWFRYPAGFSDHILDQCFAAIDHKKSGLIVDPFAGVNTTGLRACALGFNFVGLEAHPLIAEIGSIKFRRPDDPISLVERAHMLAQKAVHEPTETEHELVIRSFATPALATLISLRKQIQALKNDRWQLHLKWCLLGTLRECASVKVGWPYQRPGVPRVPRIGDPLRAFVRRAEWMSEDLVNTRATSSGILHVGDARAPEDWNIALANQHADAVITSPPYMNNFDYADATRLELYFWGVAQSWREMTTRVRSKMVVASTQQSRKMLAVEDTAILESSCPQTAQHVARLVEALQRERKARSRGKEYDQVVPSYFADLVRVLTNVRAHTMFGAPVILVLGDSAPYGVYIDTPRLLASIGEELGFTNVEVRMLRHRGKRWHTNGVRHAVGLTEQLVLLYAPGPC